MPFTVTNLLVSGAIMLPLATGGTVRISPGQTSAELPDADAANNPTLDKLVQRGMVEVQSAAKPSSRPGRTARSGRPARSARSGRPARSGRSSSSASGSSSSGSSSGGSPASST